MTELAKAYLVSRNRRRAEFRLRFAKRSGNIKDFQVAVSNEDTRKVDLSREAQGLSFARVTAASNTSSVVLMEFHGHGERYFIVEISEDLPKDVAAGRDLPLQRAVSIVLDQIKQHPVSMPPVPPYHHQHDGLGVQ